MGFAITSVAFANMEEIPVKYTCEGENIAPPLAWSGLPEGTKSLALIVDDPDCPTPEERKRTWVHWVLYNLPPAAGGLPEGVTGATLPAGTREGLGGMKKTGYGGPCPPRGRHRYFHKLYALDTELDIGTPTKEELLQAMEGHVLAQAELIGTYEKKNL